MVSLFVLIISYSLTHTSTRLIRDQMMMVVICATDYGHF